MGVLKVWTGSEWRKVGCGGSTAFTDNFDRPDSSGLGSPWAAAPWGDPELTISSNRAVPMLTTTYPAAVNYLDAGTTDPDLTVTVYRDSGSGDPLAGAPSSRIYFRYNGTDTFFTLFLTGAADDIRLTRNWPGFGGPATPISSTSYGAWHGVETVWRVACDATDGIRVYKDGVEVRHYASWHGPAIDADETLVGLEVRDDSPSPSSAHYFDDFSLGTPTTGRLKLWTGTHWVREKCDDGSVTDDFSGTGTLNGSSTTTGGLTWQSTQLRTYTMQPFTRTSGKITATSTGSLTVACSTLTLPADCTISATIAAASTTHYAGMVFRWVDASNFWLLFENVGKWYVYRFLAGAISSVLPSAPTAGVSDVVEIVMSGGSWTFRLNGTDVHTDTSGTHSAGTRHGVYQEDPYTPVLTSFTAAAIAHPLKMWDGTAWLTVARMVPV